MPKGTTLVHRGGLHGQYSCPCGYEKLVNNVRHANMIEKLHKKICETAKSYGVAPINIIQACTENGESDRQKIFETSNVLCWNKKE